MLVIFALFVDLQGENITSKTYDLPARTESDTLVCNCCCLNEMCRVNTFDGLKETVRCFEDRLL